MSGLTTFYANLGTGLFRVGSPTNIGSANGGGSTVILATNSTIQAATMLLGGPDGSANGGSSAVQSLKLGSGTNVINVDTINLCGIGTGDGRSNGNLSFNGATGTLKIRSQADPVNGRANLTIGVVNMNTGVGQIGNLLDTNGHSADLRFGTIQIASRTIGSGTTTARFQFDTGTLNANDLVVGSRSGTAAASTTTGIVTLGGGSVTINNSSGPIQLGINSLGSGIASGTLTISGGTVTIAAHAGNSLRLADASVAGGTATGMLHLTDGTLTLAGDIIRGAATGTSNASVKLSGGTLNMGGNDMGAAAAGTVTFTAESGILQNVASINGTGGLTKTTAGTLTISGTNNYGGSTTISGGTLSLGASNAIPNNPVVIDAATFNAATFSDTLGTLGIAGSAVINLGAGASLSFADSRAIDWSSGTLTLTGSFVFGSSLRFGTTSSGLSASQLAKISKPGGGAVALNSSGYLIDAPANTYATWASANAGGGTPNLDFDTDGVSNGIEYILGGTSLTKDISLLPTTSPSGANLLFTFKRAQSSINANTSVTIQSGATLQTWPSSYNVGADTATSSPGVMIQKGVPAGFDTVTLSIPRSPDAKKFLRLSVSIAP
jgi:autotransporter-associated beta strand protein